jgi:phosphate transport system substrate-binding protein
MAALLTALALTATVGWAGGAITIKGSDTMVILGQRWAEVYMQTHAGTVIQVTGGGSGTGIAALINGAADIAQSSRAMTDKEKNEVLTKRGAKAAEVATAMDGLGIYVHKSNMVARLSIAQIKAIYQGDITNWKEIGGPDAEIVLYSRENNSGTYAYFKEHVLAKEDFAPECQMLPGTATVINAVSKDPKSIGYGGIGYSSGVRVVPVAAHDSLGYFEPSEANVASGKYPLARPLFWYTAGEPKGEIAELVRWILSDDGQKVVTDVGYYPLPKKIPSDAKPRNVPQGKTTGASGGS